jgi:hypothetical protein
MVWGSGLAPEMCRHVLWVIEVLECVGVPFCVALLVAAAPVARAQKSSARRKIGYVHPANN